MSNDTTTLASFCPNYGGTGAYNGWKHMFTCIDPHFWSSFGIALAMTLSVLGAGVGILNVASSLSGCMIKSPRV